MAKDARGRGEIHAGMPTLCHFQASEPQDGTVHAIARPISTMGVYLFDFLGRLPSTKQGFDYVFVVVDRFSKMIRLMPCKKTITSEETARLFFKYVWRHFGLPSSIVSNRDGLLLGRFWKTLWSLMDTKLNFSTVFHPQTDGQTEVVNRTLVHLLRGYNAKRPKTWDESLPYIEFAFNQTMHASTARAPFEVCLGC